MDRRTDGQPSYRDGWTHLKRDTFSIRLTCMNCLKIPLYHVPAFLDKKQKCHISVRLTCMN